MSFASDRKLIFITALPHSGSTIFWRAFRKDDRLLCFDEPLTSSLGVHFPEDNPKNTFAEYSALFSNSPACFWSKYMPISPFDEVATYLDDNKIKYLQYLTAQASITVIDETHLSLMVPEIKKIHQNPYVIHLVRRASSFATSHLLPSFKGRMTSAKDLVRNIRRRIDRSIFFDRTDFHPGMARGHVIGSHPDSKFGLLLKDRGYDHQKIMRGSALVRLLAYWHVNFHASQKDGSRVFGSRFRMIRYEHFAESPSETMQNLYAWIGEPEPSTLDYQDIHPPKRPFKEYDRRWVEAAKIAGFNKEEIETLL